MVTLKLPISYRIMNHLLTLVQQVTNQVLTALDRLRHQSNVIVFCTSNLINTIVGRYFSRESLLF